MKSTAILNEQQLSRKSCSNIFALKFAFLFFNLFMLLQNLAAQTLAFPGAEGFGAYSTGGRGGDVYHVTTLWDDGIGSLREGINSAKGPRTIVFDLSGTIALQSNLVISKPNITIAGQTAPGDGICIRDYSLLINNTHDIIIRYLRLRRGDVKIRQSGKPTGSVGLDVVSIDDSKNIIFDHVSLSWSCDEIFGIVQNQNVTVQWCIISEPLGDPILHPYGLEHAYCMNNSATTLSVHHNLLVNYVMRGPNFEVNDATTSQGYHVYKEAVNNVLFDYKDSGSRYTCGIETNPGGAAGINFAFHFIGNKYICNPSNKSAQEIQATTKYGITEQLKVFVSGNIGPHRTSDAVDQWAAVMVEKGGAIRDAEIGVKNQMSDQPLFTVPVPVTTQKANDAYTLVLDQAGCNKKRDAVDLRILSNVSKNKFGNYLLSQEEVGGWPQLSSEPAQTDTDQDGMPDWWEKANGLNINDPTDRNGVKNAAGYTNLELYLNASEVVTEVTTQKLTTQELSLEIMPNPVNSFTHLKFQLPKKGSVKFTIFNTYGQKIKSFEIENLAAGVYSQEFVSEGYSAGTYLISLESGNQSVTRKMVVH